MPKFLTCAAVALLLATPAHADTHRRSVICGYWVSSAYVSGTYVACHLALGERGHINKRSCAPKPTRITGGRMTVGPDGEIEGHLVLSERGKTVRAKTWGWLSFTGNLTLAFQRDGDWKIDGLMGTGKVRPSCGAPKTVFEEDAP